MVAEKHSVWRSLAGYADDAANGGQKAHVEHAIGFVEDEHLHGAEIEQPAVEKSSSRPGVATTRRAPLRMALS